METKWIGNLANPLAGLRLCRTTRPSSKACRFGWRVQQRSACKCLHRCNDAQTRAIKVGPACQPHRHSSGRLANAYTGARVYVIYM